MSAYSEQLKFHKIVKDIPGVVDRLIVAVTTSGYRGLAVRVLPTEIEPLKDIFKNNDVNVQHVVYDGEDIIHLIQGISQIEIDSILK